MKKISAIGIKEEGKSFQITNLKLFKDNLNALPNGKYKLIIEKYYKTATNQQFGWLYACVYPMSLVALMDAGYEFTTIEQVDVFWKQMFANKEVVNRERGDIMLLPLDKKEFLTVDQMTYCNAIRDYCAEYLGVYIPDPNPNYKINKQI